jgi:hypothetical protein
LQMGTTTPPFFFPPRATSEFHYRDNKITKF